MKQELAAQAAKETGNNLHRNFERMKKEEKQ
jgi:hypothetical protein